MCTLIYQLCAAGIRHRSAGVEIGASSPFLGGEEAPTTTYFALLRGLRLWTGDKKERLPCRWTQQSCIQDSFDLRSSFFGVERALCLEVALGAHTDVLHIVFQIDGHLLALKDESAV